MKKMQVNFYQLSNGKWRAGGVKVEGQSSSANFTEFDFQELFDTKEDAENFVNNFCKKESYELEVK
jgi:hypothetical protein